MLRVVADEEPGVVTGMRLRSWPCATQRVSGHSTSRYVGVNVAVMTEPQASKSGGGTAPAA